MSELWTDERLIARAESIAASWHRVLDREQVYLLRGQIIGLLREVHDPLSVTLQACDDVRAELETQLAAARRWEPIPDGEYDMGVEDEPLYIFGNTDPDVCTHVEWQGDTVMLDLGMTVCRVAGEGEGGNE